MKQEIKKDMRNFKEVIHETKELLTKLNNVHSFKEALNIVKEYYGFRSNYDISKRTWQSEATIRNYLKGVTNPKKLKMC